MKILWIRKVFQVKDICVEIMKKRILLFLCKLKWKVLLWALRDCKLICLSYYLTKVPVMLFWRSWTSFGDSSHSWHGKFNKIVRAKWTMQKVCQEMKGKLKIMLSAIKCAFGSYVHFNKVTKVPSAQICKSVLP